MKNLLKITAVVIFMFTFIFAGNTLAQMEMDQEYVESDYTISGVTLWIDGWVVIDGTTTPIAGVRVTCTTCNNPITVYTDGNGYWYIQYHSYCGSKTFTFQADGYTTVTRSVGDHSCPECNCPDDPTAPGCGTCDNHIRIIVEMVPGGSTDTDADGVWDSIDNCFEVPNGWKLGTCTRGTKGHSCQAHRDCGCDGYCSKAQENCDGDAYGNACDECMYISGGCKSGPCPQFMSFMDITPAHKLLGPEITAQWTVEDKRIFWFVIADLWWRGHNSTSYDNVFDALRGWSNGPDKLCDECVRDENNNGICDGWEGIYYDAETNLRTLQEKFSYCLDKIRNCTEEDREEDPFGCIM